RARAPDSPPALLRRADAEPDRTARRHLADARLASDPPGAGEDSGRDRDRRAARGTGAQAPGQLGTGGAPYNPWGRTSAALRGGLLAFTEDKGTKRLPSWPLVPRADDHSTLLTTAGMQPQ